METETLPTKEQVDAALVEPEMNVGDLFEEASEKDIAQRIGSKVLQQLVQKADKEAEARYAKRLDTEIAHIIDQNKDAMKKELDKLRKANEPMTEEEVGKLLSQEYITFQVKIRAEEEREFTIRELPINVEKRILKAVKMALKVGLKELSALDWSNGMSAMDQVVKIVDAVPVALDALAECCATCLDPYKKEKPEVTKDWVLDNMNVYRMYAVLQAQAAASRWRDFFSLVYQLTPR